MSREERTIKVLAGRNGKTRRDSCAMGGNVYCRAVRVLAGLSSAQKRGTPSGHNRWRLVSTSNKMVGNSMNKCPKNEEFIVKAENDGARTCLIYFQTTGKPGAGI